MTFGLLGQILVSRQTLFRQSTYNRSDVNCQHVADLGLRFQIVLQSMDESMLRFGWQVRMAIIFADHMEPLGNGFFCGEVEPLINK